MYGLNTPLFFTPCMEAGCEKNLRFSSRSLRTSNFFPKSLQAAHRFQIWLFLGFGIKKELCLNFAEDLFCNKNFYCYLVNGFFLNSGYLYLYLYRSQFAESFYIGLAKQNEIDRTTQTSERTSQQREVGCSCLLLATSENG